MKCGDWSRVGVLVGASIGLACANPCERLCDAYYDLSLRCTLLCYPYQGGGEAVCHESGPSSEVQPTPPDENYQIQQTEYQVQQCQADYAELKPASGGEPSEAASCQAWVPTLESLLDQYNAARDDLARGALCDEFYRYQAQMNLSE